MIRSLLALALAAAAADVPRVQMPAAQAVIDDPEAYVVYATLIDDEIPAKPARKQLVVQRETVVNKDCIVSGGALETDWKPVADDFKAQNARARFVAPDRDLHRSYVVVARKDLLAYFTKGGGRWPAFYERYPDSGGYVELSAVGFDDRKTRAMVYVAHACGDLCGHGSYRLLEKVAGKWADAHVAGVSTCVWIS